MTALYFNHENLALAAQPFFHLYSLFLSVWVCVCGLISHIWAQKRDLENLLAGGGSPTLCATGISSLSLLVCVCVQGF